jgi:hypothetical protein
MVYTHFGYVNSIYHDKNFTVKTLFYAQLLYEIISLQKFAMSKKRTILYELKFLVKRLMYNLIFIDECVCLFLN